MANTLDDIDYAVIRELKNQLKRVQQYASDLVYRTNLKSQDVYWHWHSVYWTARESLDALDDAIAKQEQREWRAMVLTIDDIDRAVIAEVIENRRERTRLAYPNGGIEWLRARDANGAFEWNAREAYYYLYERELKAFEPDAIDLAVINETMTNFAEYSQPVYVRGHYTRGYRHSSTEHSDFKGALKCSLGKKAYEIIYAYSQRHLTQFVD